MPLDGAAPTAAEVMARAGGENFAVASFVLPRRARAHLLAIYGFARLVDELGDSARGDRLDALDALERELDAAFAGHAHSPLLRALTPTLTALALPREPFVRLIDANRADQRVHRYETWEQLERYCELSANPVGELVLRVLGLPSESTIALSDRICTALQLIEHCQDVREDHAAGRIYLPAQELRQCGCGESELAGDSASPALRATIAIQMRRARGLLAAGLPLISMLGGRPKLAVATYAAGGLAAIEAIEAAGCDVLTGAPVQAGALARAAALARVLSRRLGGRG
ncbi:MAG: squalene synthase HpnC [Solirubrobacteraceae bacterium]